MKYRTMICIATAASLGFGSLAFAQPERSDRRDRGDRHEQFDRDRGGDRHGQFERDRGGDRRMDQRDWREHDRGEHRGDAYSYGARGPQWRRGGHLPPEYRNRQYVVSDWRGHHLNAPPRGYQWVQVGGDYVLVAVGSGIIAQLILSQ
jgi:Ni/Co efflux regulator RcnB